MAWGNVSTPCDFHYADGQCRAPNRSREQETISPKENHIPQLIDDIHDFWFGELDARGMSPGDRRKLWFRGGAEHDERCRQQFGEACAEAIDGGLGEWEASDAGVVALVLLLDQFPRNIYRGTPRAFDGDPRARALSLEWVEHGHYQRLPASHQVFLFMPLEHSERIEDQDTCVTLFNQLAATTGSELILDFSRYAVAHREVIARFGRFPHRNEILGRESSSAELAWLEEHGGF